MNIQELKEKSSEKLITEAENLGIENASTLRRQEIYFAILKKLAEKERKLQGVEYYNFFKMDLGFLEQWNQTIYQELTIFMLAQVK